MINIERIIALLDLKQITPNQFVLCMIIFHKDSNISTKYIRYLKSMYNEDSLLEHEAEIIKDLKELELQGYVENLNPFLEGLEYFYVNNYLITPKFEEYFLIDKNIAAVELLKSYPAYMMINSTQKIPTINISVEEVADSYNSRIKGDLDTHKEVLAKVEKYKQDNRGFALQGLKKFIETEQWKYIDLEEDNNDLLKIK